MLKGLCQLRFNLCYTADEETVRLSSLLAKTKGSESPEEEDEWIYVVDFASRFDFRVVELTALLAADSHASLFFANVQKKTPGVFTQPLCVFVASLVCVLFVYFNLTAVLI